MGQPAVVLIHPPSIYDFRERPIFFGPLSDVIPSSPIFEMYPVGFLTLAAHLRRHGYPTRIVNLALLMMRSRRFQPEACLKRLRPRLFGLDLHWLPHAQGGLAVAALLKRLHPDIPIVFGGISATYFHAELIREPPVDFVLRGSVAEPNLLALVRAVEAGGGYERVPNLVWKQAGEVRVNASVPPANPDDYGLALGAQVLDVARQLDFWTSAPFHTWWRHPITAAFTVRGCERACATCGAAADAFPRFMPGSHPLRRSPAAIADWVRALADLTRAPIFLVGDLRDGGEAYARAVIDALARCRVENRLVFEFFEPPPAEFLSRLDASLARWGAEFSPETHAADIRARVGKAAFSNAQMEAALEACLRLRCEQLDLFYMIGLPGQTVASVLTTTDAIETLFQRFDRRLSAFITPLGPFLDPGSAGFEAPAEHGYRLFARTLKEHCALLETHDWEQMLNYETEWMTRAQIVEATYAAAERLNDLKERYGRITARRAAAVRGRLRAARALRGQLAALGTADAATRRAVLNAVQAFSQGTLNDKAELFPPGAFWQNFRLGGVAGLLLREVAAQWRGAGRG